MYVNIQTHNAVLSHTYCLKAILTRRGAVVLFYGYIQLIHTCKICLTLRDFQSTILQIASVQKR